jgi:peptidoglycan hydrolase-like protein with peptidoglycan-binding domain
MKRVLPILGTILAMLPVISGCAIHPPIADADAEAASSSAQPRPVSGQLANTVDPASPTEADIARIQQRLLELGFAPGPVDGIAGPAFTDALIAFQKLHDLPRDGKLSEAVLAALEVPVQPVSAIDHPGLHVEADLARQLLTVYADGRVVRILPISSGNGAPYRTQSGRIVPANTPTGLFHFMRRIRGVHSSYLGDLYNPLFFTRSGYAVHGSRQVPPHPASHGCIRIPVRDSNWFFDTVPLGAPFLVSAQPLAVTNTRGDPTNIPDAAMDSRKFTGDPAGGCKITG